MQQARVLGAQSTEAPNIAYAFETRPVQNDVRARELGHATFDDVDFVVWHKIGSNGHSMECRADRMAKYYPHIWTHLQDRYAKWKAGAEEAIEGTPLSEWPAVGRSMIENLKILHIRSVENLASVTDADGTRIGPGWRDLRDKARAWLKTAEERGKIAEALAERDSRIAAQASEMAQMREDLEELKKLLAEATKPKAKAA